jgi:hypothetical protein
VLGDQSENAVEPSSKMTPALTVPPSTPSSIWEGFQSPLVNFKHGDFFVRGNADTVKVCLCAPIARIYWCVSYHFDILVFAGESKVFDGVDYHEYGYASVRPRSS